MLLLKLTVSLHLITNALSQQRLRLCANFFVQTLRFRFPFERLEEKIQDESHSVYLLIRMRARIVLVLIVRIELDVLACR